MCLLTARFADFREVGEEVRVCFYSAARIQDRDSRQTQTGEGEAHGHAVVTIGRDLDGRRDGVLREGERLDGHSVLEFLDTDAEFPQFRHDGMDPVRFFDAHVRDVSNRRWRVGEEGRHGERLRGIADEVHIGIDAVKRFVRFSTHPDKIGTILDSTAHFCEAFAESHVSLKRVFREIPDRDQIGRAHV